MSIKWTAGIAALVLVGAAACSSGDDGNGGADAPAPSADAPEDTAATDAGGADAAVDVTALPVGDGKITTDDPQVGYLCTTQPTDGTGAEIQGPWFNGDGTFNAEAKYVVEGAVEWPSELDVTVEGDTRVLTTNNLPSHATGEYPVDRDTEAGSIDANPSDITAQSYTIELPANPTLADEPTCPGGEAGLLLTGVVLNIGIDAAGRDAVAWEVQDSCEGHPHGGGVYHYHSVTDCVDDTASDGHSDLVGYALDGFGIFGHLGEDGEVLTNEDLDECHGHTHEIEWDGETVEMYHYHATYEFPYTIGCFRGSEVNPQTLMTTGAGDTQVGGEQPPGGEQQPGGSPPSP